MSLTKLPEKPELMITTGFSATPTTMDQLYKLAEVNGRSRSAVLRHLIQLAYDALPKGKK